MSEAGAELAGHVDGPARGGYGVPASPLPNARCEHSSHPGGTRLDPRT
jgi:hypothetical protein